jgi:cell wall-associated NlpC family hydrolase
VVTIAWGGGGGGGSSDARSGAPPSARPPPPPPVAPATVPGAAGHVVETALQVLGTPYAWGGTAANGYDCSGLVQYSYAQHGVRVPRMSRDQARAGDPVPPLLEALLPGDILLFSAIPGGGVTHVGLYVGDGVFIHSGSNGVALSRLAADDPEGKYWLPRWVGARRMVAG